MRLEYIARMRPLFVVAFILCWNAVGLSLSDRVTASSVSLTVLAGATMTLAILSAGVKHAAWARDLVLRPETEYHEVSGALFFIAMFSFVLAASAFIEASQLARP